MYYKDNNNEGEDKESFVFPNWLLIITVLLIIAAIIGIILIMSKNNKTQKFGFRFY